MLRIICKSKIHQCTVTKANIRYMGSITIDETLLDASDILPNERVQIVNLNNGSRIETYVLKGKRNSGVICMNGGAALWANVGDELIIISYAIVEDSEARSYKPKVVFVKKNNKIKKIIG